MGRVWPALLLAPLLALADQGAAYALAGWSCAHPHHFVPHAVHAVFLAAILAVTFLAWPAARPGLTGLREEAGFSVHRHDGLAVSAVALGALSALVVLALWIPQWMLSPCFG